MTTEPPLLSVPEHGVPPVVDTSEAFAEVRAGLAAGSGPIAIDAERASGIRYGQRAFLVQLRRAGAGTVLLDSEELGDLSALNAALSGGEWVIHSVTQDLPCLQDRGMVPTALFDTELAARLLGWEKFGLAAVAERTLGVRLAKEHSAVDWSTRPLPEEWLNYAALDVEVLLPIRDALAAELVAAGKWEFAEQEFAHLLDFRPKVHAEPWRRTSGLAKLTSRAELAKVRELWLTRDAMASEVDIAPSKVLRDRELIDMARSRARSSDDLLGRWSRLSRADAARLFRALRRAARLTPDELPPKREPSRLPRSPFSHTEIKERTAALKAAVAEVAEEHTIPHDVLLQPALVKSLAASGREDVEAFLTEHGGRPWQVALTAPPLSAALDELPRA
ncbi:MULTISPECIES: HRDC domain-containing protein [Brevibacterium]|uniref:Ribonuclease D n=3 Tax=Bacteria TaxID=2 RepID=A0A2H1I5I2_9MICO|nr:HRDC domain-containing protein [Brevibacterium casei]NJE68186.1 ribonuclease D [Brevibacterium sp. LS14]KZE19051.1 ribonuclease D [Brevibacterium casei]MBE4696080.1 ribonuclease D [Brevibacterium casei]MBY3579202.1 ribonuclease D [Brevibacterium casei]MCT1448153.1 HRDC domain-containing protein [Brevibacterium casei]